MEANNYFDIKQTVFLEEQIPANSKILYQYEGVFSKEMIKEFLHQITLYTKNYPRSHKKIYYVFIELAQNVKKYSAWKEDNTGVGAFLLGETDNEFYFLIGNVVENGALQVLLKKCEIINSLDRESLRLFKRQQRNLIPGTNRGAHIGLIMVALTTKKPLDIRLKQLDADYSYFILNVTIEKA